MSSAVSYNIDDYESLLLALQEVLGVVVPEAQRSCLIERVEPLLVDYKLDSLSSLAASLQAGQPEDIKTVVLEVISQPYSGWTLSSGILSVLNNYVFAQLPDNARIWLVGCGQGQLAFTVAMEIAEFENTNGISRNFQLYATDNTQRDIQQAEAATYNARQLTGLSADYKKLYTTASNKGDSWTVKDRIRSRIHFSQCSLTDDFQSMGAMDVIICPEILVYYTNGVKAGILKQFATLLKSGGILLVGGNQSVTPLADGFERVEHPSGVFYRQK